MKIVCVLYINETDKGHERNYKLMGTEDNSFTFNSKPDGDFCCEALGTLSRDSEEFFDNNTGRLKIISEAESDYEGMVDKTYVPILFCPFCGEKITTDIIKTYNLQKVSKVVKTPAHIEKRMRSVDVKVPAKTKVVSQMEYVEVDSNVGRQTKRK